MPMKNPLHPGGFVLRECIEPLGLTITDAAEALGVTRKTYLNSSTRSAAYPPKLPSGSPRFSGALRKAG